MQVFLIEELRVRAVETPGKRGWAQGVQIQRKFASAFRESGSS
jgi:hypothetical protein